MDSGAHQAHLLASPSHTKPHECRACAHEQEQWCPGPIVVLASDELSSNPSSILPVWPQASHSISLGLSSVC